MVSGARRLLPLFALLAAGCPAERLPADGSVGIIACTSERDCPAALPTCDPAARICTGCIAGSCASGICDQTLHRCVPSPACQNDTDCPPSAPLCARALGHCVGCVGDSDCSGDASCRGNDAGIAVCQ